MGHFKWVILDGVISDGYCGVGGGVACSAKETKSVNHHSLNSMYFEKYETREKLKIVPVDFKCQVGGSDPSSPRRKNAPEYQVGGPDPSSGSGSLSEIEFSNFRGRHTREGGYPVRRDP